MFSALMRLPSDQCWYLHTSAAHASHLPIELQPCSTHGRQTRCAIRERQRQHVSVMSPYPMMTHAQHSQCTCSSLDDKLQSPAVCLVRHVEPQLWERLHAGSHLGNGRLICILQHTKSLQLLSTLHRCCQARKTRQVFKRLRCIHRVDHKGCRPCVPTL